RGVWPGHRNRYAGAHPGERAGPAGLPRHNGGGTRMSGSLKVEGLHAYYGKSHILHGVDLRLGEGEIVSLLGRNGVGRSTTAKAIMGLVHCTGSVTLGDLQLVGR